MSDAGRAPLVSVVTPFYNTAEFLAECIESVLSQTLGDFEYLLVDNRSTDGSREIAEAYAGNDPRIRFVAGDEHLPQLDNYNRALKLVDERATYCKIVQADDLLMPRCLEEMVTLAETDERIGMVGAYTLKQNRVVLDGLDFGERVIEGEEMIRRFLLGGRYIVGNPTTCLYRSRFVRERDPFYPPELYTGDTHAALRLLQVCRFGFVHQVLTMCRQRPGSISADWSRYGGGPLNLCLALELYGETYLDRAVLARERRRWRRAYYRVLARGVLTRKPDSFWQFHRHELAAAGLTIERGPLVWAVLGLITQAALNPGSTVRRLMRRLGGRRNG